MTTVAVVQCRMGSSRLPGKAMYPLGGTTVLGYLLRRLVGGLGGHPAGRIVVATTTLPEDTPITQWADAYGCGWTQHDDPDDVLGRFVLATEGMAPADVVVRLTGDNPLVCTETVGWCAGWVAAGRHDYYRTGETFPEGLDVEAFSVALLRRADATLGVEREHLASPLERLAERPGRYELPEDWGHLRLTLDVPEDVPVVQKVVVQLPHHVGLEGILDLARDDPSMFAGNAHVARNAWQRSAE